MLNSPRNETKIQANLLPLFLRKEKEKFANEQDLLFSNLQPLVEGIADSKPDFYDGSDQTTLEPQMSVCTISIGIRKQRAVELMVFTRIDPDRLDICSSFIIMIFNPSENKQFD